MARRRKSTPATAEARDLATAIRQGERRGLTQREIAATLGINERTVRKVKYGQTSGRAIHKRLTREPAHPSTRNAFNVEFTIGRDARGKPVFGSVNIIVPDVRDRHGNRRPPTVLDVFRMPDLAAILAAHQAAMAQAYGLRLPDDEEQEDDVCWRETCQHYDIDHQPDSPYPCGICDCPALILAGLPEPITPRLRKIGNMRKPAAAIIRTGS